MRWALLLLLTSCNTFPMAGEPVYFDCTPPHACRPIHPPDGGSR